jgi:hypothetical protein
LNTKENQMATELTKNETADDLEGVKTISFREQDYYCPYVKLVRQLSASERRQLREGIEREGRILDPLTVSVRSDGRRVLLDGHNRLEMADEMGLPEDKVPLDPRTGMTREQEANLAVQRNAERRQLTKDDIAKARKLLKERIRCILAETNGALSDRALAAQFDTSHKTVATERKKVATGLTPAKRIGRDGKPQPATKPPKKGKPPAATNGKTKPPLHIAHPDDEGFTPRQETVQKDMKPSEARRLLKDNTTNAEALYYALRTVVEDGARNLERMGTAVGADDVGPVAADLEAAARCYRLLEKNLREK